MGKSKINYASNQLIFILLIMISLFFINSFYLTYTIFSLFLVYLLVYQNSVVIKLFAILFICYYIIPLPNISKYRGTITLETLNFCTLMMLFALFPLIFKVNFKKNTNRVYKKIEVSGMLKIFIFTHLILVYFLIIYVFFTIGNIFLNQELRLQLSPIFGYILKSSIYICFFYFFLEKKSRGNKLNIFLFIILPIIPSIFIGSRGVAIVAIVGLLLLAVIKSFKNGEDYFLNRNNNWKKYFPIMKYASLIIFVLLQGVYYIRRIGSDSLLSNKDLAIQYFGNDNWYNYIIMPLHFTFRETIGLTNVIIKRDIENPIDMPLFFAELVTILPGEQPAPGRILGSIIGTSLGGGLTPGIIGALYIDYRWYALGVIFGFTMLIQWLKNKSKFSDFYKILFCITLVQFFHLFHRGFIKPEYLVAYIVIIGYYVLSTISTKKTFS